MSIRAIAWAMKQITGSPISKLVLLKLADHADDKGYCWPRVALIARETELSERTVREHLRLLEAGGFIRIVPHYVEGGRQTSNRYCLNVGGPAPSSSTPAHDAGGPSGECTHPLQVSQSNIEEPSIEPSVNHAGLTPELIARFERMFGRGTTQEWFGGASFAPGPPPEIWVETRFRCSWVTQHFGTHLRNLFGDDLKIMFRRETSE